MKKFIFMLLGFCLLSLTISANKVGVYCFFADNGSHLYEDNNIKLGVVVTNINEISVIVVNKTNNVLYIDKANCFIYTNGNTESLFSNAAYSTGTTSGGGAAVNLGGAARALGIGGVAGGLLSGTTVGGGSSSTNTTTIFEQRVLGVAPQSAQTLKTIKIYNNLSSDYLTTGSYGMEKGKFVNPLNKTRVKFQKGDKRDYTEDATPLCVKASVKYSTKENFADDTSAQVTSSNFIEHVVIDNYKGVKKDGIELPYCTPYINKSRFAFRTGGMDAKVAVPISLTIIGLYVYLFSSTGSAY